jgi:hypothetical protein
MEPNVEVRRSYRLAAQGKNEDDAMCGQPVDVASTARLCAAPSTEPRTVARCATNERAAPGQGTEAAEAHHNEAPTCIGA